MTSFSRVSGILGTSSVNPYFLREVTHCSGGPRDELHHARMISGDHNHPATIRHARDVAPKSCPVNRRDWRDCCH
ncbi:hypothetical protein PISMIDRAFT_494559 [Pisolithus microcarpus 441]|uniref:Unplaced genomic scaffold scaffold_52, whole genome shotgun sequence n=1 Tax=Pisolithus microcarpus 441 TaxID=765257 RepID=A0A0C9YD54_9AGAM|nr:hypothetical protein PISMIDRAFT_494559 [Pisolithus microcarpus 441]